VEAYGRAKLRAEDLCHQAVTAGLDVTIVRPRTILGHGRLGIMAIVFEWVADGSPVWVLGRGDNRYQFVHAADLAEACRLMGDRPGPALYNVGATEFGTMRETLQALIEHAGTGSRVRHLPMRPASAAMRVAGRLRIAPLASYHGLLYGRSLWVDSSRAQNELGWRPTYSNISMMIESYEWYLAHRENLSSDADGSHHQVPPKPGVLRLLKRAR
jgi:nucleoside-diphosphate-sugar epimerase